MRNSWLQSHCSFVNRSSLASRRPRVVSDRQTSLRCNGASRDAGRRRNVLVTTSCNFDIQRCGVVVPATSRAGSARGAGVDRRRILKHRSRHPASAARCVIREEHSSIIIARASDGRTDGRAAAAGSARQRRRM